VAASTVFARQIRRAKIPALDEAVFRDPPGDPGGEVTADLQRRAELPRIETPAMLHQWWVGAALGEAAASARL
jgi:hypothetical protein